MYRNSLMPNTGPTIQPRTMPAQGNIQPGLMPTPNAVPARPENVVPPGGSRPVPYPAGMGGRQRPPVRMQPNMMAKYMNDPFVMRLLLANGMGQNRMQTGGPQTVMPPRVA